MDDFLIGMIRWTPETSRNCFIVTRVAVRSSTGITMEGRKWKKKIVIVNLQTTLLIILLIKQWIQCQGIQMIVFFDCRNCEGIDRTLLSYISSLGSFYVSHLLASSVFSSQSKLGTASFLCIASAPSPVLLSRTLV